MTDIPFDAPRPAAAPGLRIGLAGLVRRGRAALPLHRDRRIARAAFMNTVRLDDRMLDDIGVTREEVEWAARLPLRVSAAQALRARARSRRAEEAGGGGRA